MAKLDKLKKKNKQIKRKAHQQSKLLKKAKREIKCLKHKLGKRDQIIANLRSQFVDQKNSTTPSSDAVLLAETEDKKLAVDHKNAWKRHTFLRDRYQEHLDSGQDKDRARATANQDLMDRYGNEVGFTAEQLCDILS